jgi:hypothetical protein
MDSVSDIQATLETDLDGLLQRGDTIQKFFEVINKAVKQLGVESGADPEIQKFLGATVLANTYDAFVSLNDGNPAKASWLVIRGWQEAVRATREQPISALDAQKLLEYHLAVSDFLDAEVRYSF